jgi:CubicO group peptidase (beta-lactamase class C family)
MGCHGWRFGTVVVALLACSVAHAGPYAALDTTLAPYLERYGLPALAAAVARDGKIVAAGAVGTRRAGTDTPVTVNDRFHLGSDTKAMTAVLAAMLVEEGRLRWDSTIAEVFPELADRIDPGLRQVTLVQLLSHTSGVPADNQVVDDLIDKSLSREGNLDELRYWLLREWVPQPLASTPGTTFAYANMNYLIVGAMIERISGRTWDELITERVFAPFELRTAGLGCQASLGRVDAPLSHAIVDGKTKPYLAGPNCDNPPILGPAGIANMSVLDFARWAAWNAGQGKRGPALVRPDTLRRLHARVISMPLKPDAPAGTPPGGGYALGWGELTVDWAPEPLLYHGGSNGKNLATVWVEPSRDFAIVSMTNIGGERADEGLRAVAAELYGRYLGAGAAAGAAAEVPAEEATVAPDAARKRTRRPAPFSGDLRRGKGL